VIAIPSGVRVLIATKPVDFRKGMDGLVAVVKEHLGADPFSGAIYVFRAKRGTGPGFACSPSGSSREHSAGRGSRMARCA
jgi:transposase